MFPASPFYILLQAQRWAPGITHRLVTLVLSLCYLGEASGQRILQLFNVQAPTTLTAGSPL